jgi:hypothetical protein
VNKYEALFDEIIRLTSSNALTWKQVSRHAHAELIFNPNLVFRQFAADFLRNGKNFKVLLIEKKIDDPEHDFAYEKRAPEVLVMDEEGELVTTLTDSVIERADMLRLADMVETRSDNATRLFAPGV